MECAFLKSLQARTAQRVGLNSSHPLSNPLTILGKHSPTFFFYWDICWHVEDLHPENCLKKSYGTVRSIAGLQTCLLLPRLTLLYLDVAAQQLCLLADTLNMARRYLQCCLASCVLVELFWVNPAFLA